MDVIQDEGLKNEGYGKFLINQLKLVRRWEEKMEVADRVDILKRLILKRLGFMGDKLERWLTEGGITQDSYYILISNINLLINNYQ